LGSRNLKKYSEFWSLSSFLSLVEKKNRCRTNLMHFLLPICGKFTRALLAHQIFLTVYKVFLPQYYRICIEQALNRYIISTEDNPWITQTPPYTRQKNSRSYRKLLIFLVKSHNYSKHGQFEQISEKLISVFFWFPLCVSLTFVISVLQGPYCRKFSCGWIMNYVYNLLTKLLSNISLLNRHF
jgi:hypothetical protein